MLSIIFWILFILCVISALVPASRYPWMPRLNTAILLILIGILAWKTPNLHVPL